MRQQYTILLLLLLLAGLTSCSPGHQGSNEIAFIRDGHLWTIDPDGANAYEIIAQDTPVVGYGWSPTHQILFFRALDADFARTSAAKHLASNSVTGLIEDVPSTVNTVGIDGGSPISIMLSSRDVQYSNAIWNTTGTRLIYRQEATGSHNSVGTAGWWASQNDQPAGIAAKFLPDTYSIPSIDYTNHQAIGNSRDGIFTVTLAGTDRHFLFREALPGHPLPATLERVLWRPAHQQPSILYAIATSSHQSASTHPLTVQLLLRDMDGHTTPLTTCACMQFTWSPDGNHVLYSIGSTYTILNLNDHSSFDIAGESESVPYWSPDGRFLLLDGPHTLFLVQVAARQYKILLSDTHAPSEAGTDAVPLPDAQALLQPVSNSWWAADSRHFLFLTRNRLLWQGHQLSTGKGLYTVTINSHGQPQGKPVVVDTGNDSQAGWTYEDANTSFLY